MAIHYLNLLDVSNRIRRRELSSEEVTRVLLGRISRYDWRFNSSALVLGESALEQARQADAEIRAGLWRGPLHGVPIGIKDLLWTKGLPTMAGMPARKDFRPESDATIVTRLKRAGAVIIAKHHMTEGATMDHHPQLPRPLNPWSTAHWTGVSSSGSAVATAAGFCFGAIGSDTGGSIRMPSAAQNLTGIKPTWGRVSRHGVIHLSESLDHFGPMARSTADAAAILQAIAGPDPHDPTSLLDPVPDYSASCQGGLESLVLGIDWKFAAGDVPKEIVDCLQQAIEVLEDLGMRVREVEFPGSAEEFGAMVSIFSGEAVLAHAEYFPAKAELYGPWLKNMLEQASRHVSPAELARANLMRARFQGRIRRLFSDVDALITPGLGRLLPTWEEIERNRTPEMPFDPNLIRFTMPFNLAGVPTLSVPGGFSASGLPIGLQFIGPWLSEPMLIRMGCAFQRVTSFHTRHPKLGELE